MNIVRVLPTVLLLTVCCHRAVIGATLDDVMAALTDMKTEMFGMKIELHAVKSVVDLFGIEHLESYVDDVHFTPDSTCASDEPATSLPLVDVDGVPDGASGEARCALYCRDLAGCTGFNLRPTEVQCDLYAATPSTFSPNGRCQYYKAVRGLREADPCTSSPCRNGGTCTKTSSTTFTCSCTALWTGSDCSTEADPCTSSPCQNDGVCTKTSSTTFTCACTVEWTGNDCSTEAADPCTSDPCKNAGTCTKTSGTTFTCACLGGWTGNDCSTVADPCTSDPCKNAGTCTKTSGTTFTCDCLGGWTGNDCSTVADPCTSGPCKNAGTCTKTSSTTFTCACTAAWTGTDCSTVNPCANNPCLNSGQCSVDGAQFKCTCTTGWSGNVCDQPNPCASNPCQNGGQCSVNGAQFKCTCTTGWSGNVCDCSASAATAATVLVMQKSGGPFTTYFQKTWAEYKVGFGDSSTTTSNYWLGLDRLHELTTCGQYKMHFDIQTNNDNIWWIADYTTFLVGDEASGYQLTVGGYSGTPSYDAMQTHNGMKFTTMDKNSYPASRNCAAAGAGGFWYMPDGCCNACINWGNMMWASLSQMLKAVRMTLIRK